MDSTVRRVSRSLDARVSASWWRQVHRVYGPRAEDISRSLSRLVMSDAAGGGLDRSFSPSSHVQEIQDVAALWLELQEIIRRQREQAAEAALAARSPEADTDGLEEPDLATGPATPAPTHPGTRRSSLSSGLGAARPGPGVLGHPASDLIDWLTRPGLKRSLTGRRLLQAHAGPGAGGPASRTASASAPDDSAAAGGGPDDAGTSGAAAAGGPAGPQDILLADSPDETDPDVDAGRLEEALQAFILAKCAVAIAGSAGRALAARGGRSGDLLDWWQGCLHRSSSQWLFLLRLQQVPVDLGRILLRALLSQLIRLGVLSTAPSADILVSGGRLRYVRFLAAWAARTGSMYRQRYEHDLSPRLPGFLRGGHPAGDADADADGAGAGAGAGAGTAGSPAGLPPTDRATPPAGAWPSRGPHVPDPAGTPKSWRPLAMAAVELFPFGWRLGRHTEWLAIGHLRLLRRARQQVHDALGSVALSVSLLNDAVARDIGAPRAPDQLRDYAALVLTDVCCALSLPETSTHAPNQGFWRRIFADDTYYPETAFAAAGSMDFFAQAAAAADRGEGPGTGGAGSDFEEEPQPESGTTLQQQHQHQHQHDRLSRLSASQRPDFAALAPARPPGDDALGPELLREVNMAASQFSFRTMHILRAHRPPRLLLRYWLPLLAGTLAAGPILGRLASFQPTVANLAQEAVLLARRLLTDWVVAPLLDVYDTVKYGGRGGGPGAGQLRMINEGSLELDRALLERMVTAYAEAERQREPPMLLRLLTPGVENQLDLEGAGGRDGVFDLSDARLNPAGGELAPELQDMAIVNAAFERETRRPLLSAVIGPLPRLLLIQVQKTRVDLETALAAVDRLLRANTLNFALVAVTPATALVLATLWGLRNALRRARGLSTSAREAQLHLCESMRGLERTLINSFASSADTLLLTSTAATPADRSGAAAPAGGPSQAGSPDDVSPLSPGAFHRHPHSGHGFSDSISEHGRGVPPVGAPGGPLAGGSSALALDVLAPTPGFAGQALHSIDLLSTADIRLYGRVLIEVEILRRAARRAGLPRAAQLRQTFLRDCDDIERFVTASVHALQRGMDAMAACHRNQALQVIASMYRTFPFLVDTST
ncbi:hypothetical protein H696_01973 [Fonticula alba]|uniref:Nuclear control of ATPase protein 2 n=1 Tax=Fonticula alba TaxID=691883 RepID=A0A058ZC64_FONAL|nr:hypothetical protein H696_01973 [Fonticula alba]KCV71027.1 hypothetical protein H696_01973 [Fonticula alba]|eukprot:XP_009494150.1 hypothetical protein H696_01973 [Fonticula alba]